MIWSLKTKCLPQPAATFLDDLCFSPVKPKSKKKKKSPNKKHTHNNHLVSVIPKSIYSHSHPADVMHHSTANLTSLSNILMQPRGGRRISFS